MKHLRLWLCSALLWIMACSTPASAATRTEQWAQLPNWTGLWEMGMGGGEPPAAALTVEGHAAPAPVAFGPNENWPFTAQAKTSYEALQKKLAALQGTEQMPDTTVTECTWGFPRVLSGPYQFEVTVTPELTFFNYDIGEFRHVWTDGRKHPAPLTPTSSGHSVGHWEGNTLVVDTVGVRSGLWITGEGVTLSDQARFTERWTLQGANILSAEVTITDAKTFTAPYTLKRQFKRITDTNRMIQQNCFENLHEVKEGDRVITQFSTGQ